MSQPSALTAARQHAQALAGSGDLAGARAVLERAVEVGRAGLGEDDPEVLATAHQLAAVHQQADDPAAARRVLEEAYAAGQWRLGDADPLMLTISYDLGVVAAELGNRHEARRAFSRVADNGPAVLGAGHWTVARARAFLGDESPTVQPEEPAARVVPTPGPGPANPGGGTPQAPPGLATPRDTTGGGALSEATAIVPIVEPRPAPNTSAGAPFPPTGQERPVTHPTAPPPRPAAVPMPAPFAPPAAAPASGPPQSPASRFAAPPPVPAPAPGAMPAAAPVASTSGRRGPALFAAIAAVLAAMIAVVALVVVLARGNDRPRQPDQPTLGGAPPTDVRLRDSGTSIEVSWTDPASGMTSFVVMGGRSGQLLTKMGAVGPGQTSLDLQGLNPELEYCIAVVAVYSTSKFASSPQTCTSRSGSGAQPSATQ
ncbi:tetratricopeptide repeat protein [Krasilnikovia sp. M28-CT-15]|uniref:fibronectin type III domain-containing protein n=1 Tax=Krasilnikovia sp. M28-CT-15 TaxID=3373540 RepID=UPI003876B552